MTAWPPGDHVGGGGRDLPPAAGPGRGCGAGRGRLTCRKLEQAAEEVVCATTPALLVAVGQAYCNFGQTTDEEVCALLDAARTTNDNQAAGG